MFETLGAPELLIIGAIVIVLFGAGKIAHLGKDLGTAVREFRTALKDDDPASPALAPGTAQLSQIAGAGSNGAGASEAASSGPHLKVF